MNRITVGYFPENIKLPEGSSENSKYILFLETLLKSPQVKEHFYKGFSLCRCCQKVNGSREYEVVVKEQVFLIPEGYLHYLRDHKLSVDPNLIKLMNLWEHKV